MRKKRPIRSSIDQVWITGNGEYAGIEFADSSISSVSLKIGPDIQDLSDQEILDIHNQVVATWDHLAAQHENVVVEIPPGLPPN